MCWNLSSLIPYPGSASNNFPASSKHGLFLISIEHGNKQAVDINQSEILIWILIFFQNWQLRIQSVRMDDSGDYMCQVFFLLKKIMSLFYICVLIYCMFRNIYDTILKIKPFPSPCTLLNDSVEIRFLAPLEICSLTVHYHHIGSHWS